MTMPISDHVQLQPFNTFHVKAFADRFISISDPDALKQLLEAGRIQGQPVFILGGGSNVLFTGDFRGLILHVSIKGSTEISRTEDHLLLEVGAGENWHNFVMSCVEKDLGGIENLALIPGTVGAAPIQNIGAYGVEVQEVIERVVAMDMTDGKQVIFENNDCRFGYRDSFFKHEGKGRYLIMRVVFRLTTRNHRLNVSYTALQHALQDYESNKLSVKNICEAVIRIRTSKLPDPAKLGNAGSFFKNPVIARTKWEMLKRMRPDIPMFEVSEEEVKVPAAWLIERCGWKGKRFGDVGIYDHQPLVLVNYGNADGRMILSVSKQIQASVLDEFGIELTPEVTLL